MFLLPDYTIDGLLYESRQSRVYRGRRSCDGLPIILKVLNQDSPSPEKRARFQQEYDLMRSVQSDAILSAYGLASQQGIQVMILEDFGGTSLNNLNLGAMPLKEWLALALHITACLQRLHEQHIMHKDINPSNIVWNRQSGQVKLIDLGISTKLSREVPEVRDPERLEGTLAYLSPEQTGRMNRAMDYRTDFYSLGVTLYELLTGQLPFASRDALELVHAHIAKRPMPVEQIRPDVPPMLSRLIDKMMSKTAEERYQSAAGLQYDVQACAQSLDDSGHIAEFPLGRNDFSGRLQIPQKLYGRERQVATLLDVYARASVGPAELLLVAGYSGVGKSALVHEIQKSIVQRHGFFIEGKFEQYKRDIPYAALSQALGEWIQQILTQDESMVAQWQATLLQALGNNAQVVIDVIPDLALIVGQQPAVIKLPVEQEKNRFEQAFQNFIGALASDEHPLALFLDDLQWADSPSLQLMSQLLRSPATPHLLLIGTYRDNEITPTHPLPLILHEMQNNGAAVHTVTLRPLNLDEVTQLLRDTLHTPADKTRALAQLCLAKTEGNPFFLNQFLGALVEREILHPNVAQGYWEWEIDSIRQAGITDNIVELMVDKLQKLPPATQHVLHNAACLGNEFDLRMVAFICGMPETDTAGLLWDALREELIVPLNDHYKYAAQLADGHQDGLLPSYRFLHDRVQQAAYLQNSEAEKAAMHLAIGRLWLKTYTDAEQQERLFDLVNHLNLGRELITEPAERLRVAQLNLDAGRHAKTSAAYKPALVYLETALGLMDERDWDEHYDLMFALHLGTAEAAYLTLDIERMEHIIKCALPKTVDLPDQAKLYEIRIQSHIDRENADAAISDGLKILKVLGIKFPKNATKSHAIFAIIKLKFMLMGKDIDSLMKLPVMTDARMLAANNILDKIGTQAFRNKPYLNLLFRQKRMQLFLKYGQPRNAGFAYGGISIVFGHFLNDPTRAEQFSNLSILVQERYGSEFDKPRVLFVVHSLCWPWTKTMRQVVQCLAQDYLLSMERGAFEFAGHAASVYCAYSFHSENILSELLQESVKYLRAVEKMPLEGTKAILQIYQQGIMFLMADAPGTPQSYGLAFEKHEFQYLRRKEGITGFCFLLMKLVLLYLFHEYDEAIKFAPMASAATRFTTGSHLMVTVNLYDSLVHLARLEAMMCNERTAALRHVKKNQKKLRHWANHAPANYLNKWYLVDAEMARCSGDVTRAMKSYEQAIRLAKENQFIHEEALAKELAGEFYLALGMEFNARFYLKQAQHAYRRWGALAKVHDLAKRYPEWLDEHREQPTTVTSATDAITVTQTTLSGNLDFATAMKASQALSKEIVLERLLKQLMQVAIESAGAQRGVLLIRKGNQWFVEAEKSQEIEQETAVLQSIALDEMASGNESLPLSMVRYVSHTKESIVIDEAADEKLVANDPYVQSRRPRSMMLVPIQHHGEMTGMLYLENNAASGAFTKQRLDVLRLLASQAAISIENAHLYANMEELVKARTAELAQSNYRLSLVNQAQQEHQSELTRFLAVASHDLRQPMHALNLYLGALQNVELNGTAQPLLANVTKCAQIMDKMFLALLDLSRLDAQLVKPHIEHFPIDTVLTRLAVEYAPQAQANGIAFHIDHSN
ncbi:MAG: AAA family ATPase, partial [Burkholderiaceae bacterium]